MNISPCGNCTYNCFDKNIKCPYIDDDIYHLYDSICASDMVYYIIPNYCDFPNANFFIFNERSQCYFQKHPELLKQYLEVKKKFIVVTNTEQSNFLQVLRYHVIEAVEPDILFLSSRHFKKVSIKDNLMESEDASCLVKDFTRQY